MFPFPKKRDFHFLHPNEYITKQADNVACGLACSTVLHSFSYVTCEACKETEIYKQAVIDIELRYEGQSIKWFDDILKNIFPPRRTTEQDKK